MSKKETETVWIEIYYGAIFLSKWASELIFMKILSYLFVSLTWAVLCHIRQISIELFPTEYRREL